MKTDYKKLYEEAVNKIKSIIAEKKSQGLTNCLFEGDLNEIFPQLKESDDERIRKALIKIVNGIYQDEVDYAFVEDEITYKQLFAWLEKQGEQPHWKPTVDQMQSLYFAVITYSKKDDYKLTYDSLNSLYDDLKKL